MDIFPYWGGQPGLYQERIRANGQAKMIAYQRKVLNPLQHAEPPEEPARTRVKPAYRAVQPQEPRVFRSFSARMVNNRSVGLEDLKERQIRYHFEELQREQIQMLTAKIIVSTEVSTEPWNIPDTFRNYLLELQRSLAGAAAEMYICKSHGVYIALEAELIWIAEMLAFQLPMVLTDFPSPDELETRLRRESEQFFGEVMMEVEDNNTKPDTTRATGTMGTQRLQRNPAAHEILQQAKDRRYNNLREEQIWLLTVKIVSSVEQDAEAWGIPVQFMEFPDHLRSNLARAAAYVHVDEMDSAPSALFPEEIVWIVEALASQVATRLDDVPTP